MDETHQVVAVTAEHGYPRVLVLAELLHHFRHAHADVQELDAGAWRHDLDDLGFPGFQEVVDEHAFGGVEHALGDHVLHQGAEFVNLQQVLASPFLADDPGGDAIGDHADQPAQRRHEAYPEGQRRRHQACADAHRVADGDGLGGHFAEKQQQREHDDDVDRAGAAVAVEADQDPREVDGGRDVDQFVAAQDGDDQSPRLVEKVVKVLRLRVAIAAEFLQVEARKREKGGFGTRKKCRQNE